MDINKKIANITVMKISDDELKSRALKNQQQIFMKSNKSVSANNIKSAPKKYQNKWIVIYIRHNLVIGYDSTVYYIKDQHIYNRYKKAVLKKIAEVYPQYKDQCELEIAELEHSAHIKSNKLYKRNYKKTPPRRQYRIKIRKIFVQDTEFLRNVGITTGIRNPKKWE